MRFCHEPVGDLRLLCSLLALLAASPASPLKLNVNLFERPPPVTVKHSSGRWHSAAGSFAISVMESSLTLLVVLQRRTVESKEYQSRSISGLRSGYFLITDSASAAVS